MAFDDLGVYWNAGFFLAQNDDATYYYENMMNVLKWIELATQSQIIIYGGYIRRIVENCMENVHKSLDDRPFKPPPNINIWLLFPEAIHNDEWISKKMKILQILGDKFGIYSMEHPSSISDNPIFKIFCCNIHFEIKTKIISKYNYTICENCDFTANNLMMDMNGKILERTKSQYDYNTIFNDIVNKKLRTIYKFKYSASHPLTTKAQIILEQRREKMIKEGYS